MSQHVIGTIKPEQFNLLVRVWDMLKGQGKVDGSLELGTFNSAVQQYRVRWIHADDCCENLACTIAFNSGVVSAVRIMSDGTIT
jgi:hypothetical protein